MMLLPGHPLSKSDETLFKIFRTAIGNLLWSSHACLILTILFFRRIVGRVIDKETF